MNRILDYLAHHWRTLAWPAAVFCCVLAAGWVVRRVVFGAVRRWAEKSGSRFGEPLARALYGPFLLWAVILAAHVAVESSDLPRGAMATTGKWLLALWIVSLTIAAARLAAMLVRFYGNTLNAALPVTTLTQNLASLAVVTLGLLVLLDTLNISITPMLTALGVGGLAVALALQDTLSNLFAGIHVSVAGQIRAGDYIKLNTGEEGYVTDIGWRCTTLRALANNLVIVPNAKLAQAIVTNYHLPETVMGISIPVAVSYDTDPDTVERVLVDEATRGTAEIPGLLAEPAPSVRFIPGFGEYALNLALNCSVATFVDQYAVQHELRKRILKRFRREGIEIPLPGRSLYMKGEGRSAGTGGRD